MSFGVLLKQQRKKCGLTQEKLAALVNVAPITIAMYESGKRYPSADITELLAKCLYAKQEERTLFISHAHRPLPALHNLPTMLTPLCGREPDLLNLTNLLTSQSVRLVTLKGPVGIGKTRLAIELATRLNTTFSDGVFLVDLASIGEPELVFESIVQTVSHTLETTKGTHRSSNGFERAFGLSASRTESSTVSANAPEQLVWDLLPTGRTLLLLDNVNQIAMAALEPHVLRLLHARSGLKIVLTSWKSLQVSGENVFEVPPLVYPRSEQRIPSAVAAGYPAVQLFVERAKATKPDFALTDENCNDVVALCAELGGLPLAIEFTARQSIMFSPQDLRTRLVSQQHTSLTNAFDVVYYGLPAREQALFRRLGVFAASCSLEAISAVSVDLFANENGAEPDSPFARTSLGVTDTLKALIDHSLLQRIETGDSRYAMLDIIRAYARKQLALSGETVAARQPLIAYYLDLSQQAAQQLHGSQRDVWLQRLERDESNLLAALEWAIDSGTFETAAQICNTLVEFWRQRGYWLKARTWLDTVLGYKDRLSMPLRAQMLRQAGLMARRLGEYARAQAWFDQYLALCRAANDEYNIAYTLNVMGLIAAHQKEYLQAAQQYEASLELWIKLASERNIAAVWGNQANLATMQGAYERALELHTRAYELRTKRNDVKGTSYSLCNLGMVTLYQGDFRTARSYFEASLRLAHTLPDPYLLATILCNLGFSLLAQGDILDAAGRFRESLGLYRDLGDQRGMAYAIEGFASVAALRQQAERTARLFGAAEALRERINAHRPQSDNGLYDQFLIRGRIQRSELAYTFAFKSGRFMSLHDAVAEALAD